VAKVGERQNPHVSGEKRSEKNEKGHSVVPYKDTTAGVKSGKREENPRAEKENTRNKKREGGDWSGGEGKKPPSTRQSTVR